MNVVYGNINRLLGTTIGVVKSGISKAKSYRQSEVRTLAVPPYDDCRTEYQVYIEKDNDPNNGKYPEAFPQLVYSTRKDARELKRALKTCSRSFKCHIIKREYDCGFIASEVEVF